MIQRRNREIIFQLNEQGQSVTSLVIEYRGLKPKNCDSSEIESVHVVLKKERPDSTVSCPISLDYAL